jgi:integrase
MLKLEKRGKSGIWQIKGTIAGQRYRESTGTTSEPHAQVLLARRQSEALDRAVWGAKRTTLFAEAVSLYLEGGGEAQFVGKLLDRFGAQRMADITQSDVQTFARDAYRNSGPQSVDRTVFTPLIAIYRAANAAGMCELPSFRRPKMPDREAVTFARDEDLARLLPKCGARLRAAVLFLSYTGARASEACRLEDPHIDWRSETALLRKTKNGRPRLVVLAPIVVEALRPLRGTVGAHLRFCRKVFPQPGD